MNWLHDILGWLTYDTPSLCECCWRKPDRNCDWLEYRARQASRAVARLPAARLLK